MSAGLTVVLAGLDDAVALLLHLCSGADGTLTDQRQQAQSENAGEGGMDDGLLFMMVTPDG